MDRKLLPKCMLVRRLVFYTQVIVFRNKAAVIGIVLRSCLIIFCSFLAARSNISKNRSKITGAFKVWITPTNERWSRSKSSILICKNFSMNDFVKLDCL